MITNKLCNILVSFIIHFGKFGEVSIITKMHKNHKVYNKSTMHNAC